MTARYRQDLDWVRQQATSHADDFEVMLYQLQDDDDLSDEHLDALITQVAAPILAGIDCTQCGNCCRALQVYLEAPDVQRLAEGCHIAIADIETRYMDQDVLPDSGAVGRFARQPCYFLAGTRCSVYEHRPQACRDYPFLTPDFRWSMEQLLPGAAICPIIYHTLDALLPLTDEITAGRL